MEKKNKTNKEIVKSVIILHIIYEQNHTSKCMNEIKQNKKLKIFTNEQNVKSKNDKRLWAET